MRLQYSVRGLLHQTHLVQTFGLHLILKVMLWNLLKTKDHSIQPSGVFDFQLMKGRRMLPLLKCFVISLIFHFSCNFWTDLKSEFHCTKYLRSTIFWNSILARTPRDLACILVMIRAKRSSRISSSSPSNPALKNT